MNASDRSLLSFIDVPVVVGDPDGRAVWANPAFLGAFDLEPTALGERTLAELFAGGARERILSAIVRVCGGGDGEEFPLREGGHEYQAVVSAIAAEGECVGVVVLLKQGLVRAERLLTLQRQLDAPLDELSVALDSLLEQTGGRRADGHRAVLEDGLRALVRLRKVHGEVAALLSGEPVSGVERFDPKGTLQRVFESTRRRSDGPVDLLVDPRLPEIAGDESALESALARMASARLAGGGLDRLVLAARLPSPEPSTLLISLTELRAGGGAAPPLAEPAKALEALETLGAVRDQLSIAGLGRTTLLRIPVDPGPGTPLANC